VAQEKMYSIPELRKAIKNGMVRPGQTIIYRRDGTQRTVNCVGNNVMLIDSSATTKNKDRMVIEFKL
jgi:hypothetical protein